MIYYTMEMVEDTRKILRRIREAGYFCYDNGVTVTQEDSLAAQKVLSDVVAKLESIRPPKRSAKEGIQDAKRRGHLG